ncbi:hypothetical protein BGZ46_002161, partial [Entomortierella lignicola]
MAKPKKQATGDAASTSISKSGASSTKPRKQNAVETLRTVVPSIFQESQKTSANHRKNAIMLRKIQE